jgi:hypothetical protein
MITNKQKQLQMWYKVQELTEKGLNKSQIREATGLDRATIRKYQQIDETSFHSMLSDKRMLPKKLQDYRDYIKSILQENPIKNIDFLIFYVHYYANIIFSKFLSRHIGYKNKIQYKFSNAAYIEIKKLISF